MSEYPKIPGPFKRFTEGPQRNQLDRTRWTSPELSVLAHMPIWQFTEKVDGTNIRVIWDGHKPEFRGRTDRAELHPELLARLQELFTEEILEQNFGSDEVVLYGEGYGAGIQKGGGKYSPRKDFILFDVRIGRWWLRRDDVFAIAKDLSIGAVPEFINMTSVDEAIIYVTNGLKSQLRDGFAEGVVGTTHYGLLDRSGQRISVKIKHEDFYAGEARWA